MVKSTDYFQDARASGVVLASAVCAIGWGVINAIFIKAVDMDENNHEVMQVIEDAIKEGNAAKGGADNEAINDEGNDVSK